MQNDCEIYVDPEEDEVFFGCVSEREKTVVARLKSPGSVAKNNAEFQECEKEEGTLGIIKSSPEMKEILPETKPNSTPPPSQEKDNSTKSPSNTSVELEHNYSTPMKHKIDKSILTTPKSIVKADKDGGFLKVLSEIALVKAEADEEKPEENKDEENKENKKVPEIKVTEPTPEKPQIISPARNINHDLRRFRIIYNSPQCEDNKPKNFDSERNYKNKWKTVDLIDFSDLKDSDEHNISLLLDEDEDNDEEETEKKDEFIILETKSNENLSNKNQNPPNGLRFSKDARKVVEVLKKSTFDDTLNFTVPEINLEEEENSFLSPEPVPEFNETVIENLPEKAKTTETEKEKQKETPSVSQKKLEPMRYFSERKIHNRFGSETKTCAKKLPLDDKRPATVEKIKSGRIGDTHGVPTSRIPVFGSKSSKIPLNERLARTVAVKTPSKTPLGNVQRNNKFNHIESPINAYIHNKPTCLVINVKPKTKKESFTKLWKPQGTTGNNKKEEEKKIRSNPGSAVKLPFVDYKSGTPFKIEKKPESRLPRLAPTVMKLIGSPSPEVIRHKGRFYMNSPRKQNSTESTIVADENEVSVVLSYPAQKSNTIK